MKPCGRRRSRTRVPEAEAGYSVRRAQRREPRTTRSTSLRSRTSGGFRASTGTAPPTTPGSALQERRLGLLRFDDDFAGSQFAGAPRQASQRHQGDRRARVSPRAPVRDGRGRRTRGSSRRPRPTWRRCLPGDPRQLPVLRGRPAPSSERHTDGPGGRSTSSDATSGTQYGTWIFFRYSARGTSGAHRTPSATPMHRSSTRSGTPARPCREQPSSGRYSTQGDREQPSAARTDAIEEQPRRTSRRVANFGWANAKPSFWYKNGGSLSLRRKSRTRFDLHPG